MIVFLIIFVLGVFALLAWVIYKMGEVDDRQEELDKYSVYLDERANKLALWEEELKRLNKVVMKWDREDGK